MISNAIPLFVTAISIIAFCIVGIGTFDGHPIIAFPYPFGFQINGFLYGSLLIHPDIYPASVEHELIHWEQQEKLGFKNYIVEIAIPSMIGYYSAPFGMYYEQPWEKSDDLR